WQRQTAIVRLAPFVELGIGFDLDGLDVGLNWWYGPSEQIDRYRTAVADPTSGRRLVTLLGRLEREGFTISGDQLSRPPRAPPPTSARAPCLRHRTLKLNRYLGCEDWLHTSAAADHLLASFVQLKPLSQWLISNVVQGA